MQLFSDILILSITRGGKKTNNALTSPLKY